MGGTRVLGVVLLIVGSVLIIAGVMASRSVADSLSSAFLGRFTQHTTWYFVFGIASAAVGLVLTLGVFRSRR